MTGADLVTRVRDVLNEPSEDFWKDAEILKWLNEGVSVILSELPFDLARRNGLWQNGIFTNSATGTSFTISAGSTSIMDITSVTVNSQKALLMDWDMYQEKVALSGNTDPYFKATTSRRIVSVMPSKETIAVTPVITASVTITVSYNKVDTIASATNTYFSDFVTDNIVNFAIAKSKLKDEKLEEYSFILQSIKAEMQKYRERAASINDTGRKA